MSTRSYLYTIIFITFSCICCSPTPSEKEEIRHDRPQPMKSDFDFLIGEWELKNKALQERLVGSNVWIESKGHSKIYYLMDGYGIMDEYESVTPSGLYQGLGLKLFNPNINTWSIYWTDNTYSPSSVIPQVTGSFVDRASSFEGQEQFNGKPVRLRFIWKDIQENSFTWQQAYYDSLNQNWEINMISKYERIN